MDDVWGVLVVDGQLLWFVAGLVVGVPAGWVCRQVVDIGDREGGSR